MITEDQSERPPGLTTSPEAAKREAILEVLQKPSDDLVETAMKAARIPDYVIAMPEVRQQMQEAIRAVGRYIENQEKAASEPQFKPDDGLATAIRWIREQVKLSTRIGATNHADILTSLADALERGAHLGIGGSGIRPEPK